MEEVFPHAIPLAHDGFGNYWIVDLGPQSVDWAPIYFASHDPPVIAFQSPSFEHFLNEVLRLANPPHESELDTVHERVVSEIWRHNPGAVSVREARLSEDQATRTFAQSLTDACLIVDLRNAGPGDGFSWGRYGPRTKAYRFGELPIFAYESKSRLQRIFNR